MEVPRPDNLPWLAPRPRLPPALAELVPASDESLFVLASSLGITAPATDSNVFIKTVNLGLTSRAAQWPAPPSPPVHVMTISPDVLSSLRFWISAN